MEKLEDSSITNEHWLLIIRFVKSIHKVYIFDSGTELTDDVYLEDLKNQAIYDVVGYGWCNTIFYCHSSSTKRDITTSIRYK